MFCGGLQSQVSARLGICTRHSHLGKFWFLGKYPSSSDYPFLCMKKACLVRLLSYYRLLLLECYLLSPLRLPHVRKTFLPIHALCCKGRDCWTSLCPGSTVISKPPAALRHSSSYSYSHVFTKSDLLMLLCEDVCSEALFMAAGDQNGDQPYHWKVAVWFHWKCGQDKHFSLVFLFFSFFLLFFSFFGGRGFTSGLIFCCRLHLLTVNRS